MIKNFNQKNRDRSLDELIARRNEFKSICNILNNLKIDYFLIGGALLGAIRNNDFIKWDWGVDIGILNLNDFFNKFELLVNSLKEKNFYILSTIKEKQDLKIYFKGKFPKEVSAYTIFSWNYSNKEKKYWRREYSIPEKFLKNFSKIEFQGVLINCPFNPEEYLTHAYGDWKIPMRSSDKNLYNSKQYYIENKKNFFRKSVFILKNFFKN